MNTYKVIGLMSGSSLDGVDVAYCIFKELQGKWSYEIVKATTCKYSDEWTDSLKELHLQNAFNFVKTHIEYGHYLGQLVDDFITKNKLSVDFISSHGHTIFHQPDKKITCQIGDGSAIAANTGCPVVCDFRSLDIALGGQGAPLVPIGDKLLFRDFDYCLNIGGFANISYDNKNTRIAYDICPANIILNMLAEKLNKKYDDKGEIAHSGNINESLLNELNEIAFYKQIPPKSLGREWLYQTFIPVLDKHNIPINNKLRTICEHIAIQISLVTKNSISKKMLVTGGGAFNDFLIARIKIKTKYQIVIPDKYITEYKEALIFAFLGVLRIRQEPNCLISVTGAKKDNIGGAVYYG